MKKQQIFHIRILAFLLCTVLLSSTVFMSYGNTLIVKAVDQSDLVMDAAIIAISSLGLVLAGPSLAGVVSILGPQILNEGKDVYDYVTDNGDGTTTISEDFVQLTLSAYQDYVKENFDGTLNYNEMGGYYEYGASLIQFDYYTSTSHKIMRTEITGFSYAYPVAYLFINGEPSESSSGMSQYQIVAYFFNGNAESSNGGIYKVTDYTSLFVEQPVSKKMVVDNEKVIIDSTFSGWNVGSLLVGSAVKVFPSISCPTIPVYTSYELMAADLRNGKFIGAENFRLSGQSSMYTGAYGGGDITVQTEKLGNIEEKLEEINETDKSIDDKLKDLLDWLGIGDGSGTAGGGIAPAHWYDAVLDYLDKILKQLKSIKRWTVIDTFIDGVDAIADWLDLIHDILSDFDDGMESAVATLSSALDDASGLLKTKFPFSVPWDIFFFVTLLAAEPEVPYFEVPIDFDVSAVDMHVHYDFILDFTDYQYLSDIFRVVLSMTYALGLLKMTAGIVSTKKEE